MANQNEIDSVRLTLEAIQEHLDHLVSADGYAAASVIITGFDGKHIELSGQGGLGQKKRDKDKQGASWH